MIKKIERDLYFILFHSSLSWIISRNPDRPYRIITNDHCSTFSTIKFRRWHNLSDVGGILYGYFWDINIVVQPFLFFGTPFPFQFLEQKMNATPVQVPVFRKERVPVPRSFSRSFLYWARFQYTKDDYEHQIISERST